MTGNRRVAIVGAALSDCGRVDDKTPFELHQQGSAPGARRRRADQGRRRRLRLERHRARSPPIEVAEYLGLRPTGPTARASAAARGSSWSSTRPPRSSAGLADVVVLAYGSTTRADLKRRRRTRQPVASAPAGPCSSTRRTGTRSSPSTRWSPAGTCTSSARRSSSSPRSRCRPATTRRSTPTRTTATRSRSTTCSRRR